MNNKQASVAVELLKYLPDQNSIQILSSGDDSHKKEQEKIYIGWDEVPSGAYIKYEPSDSHGEHGMEIFSDSYHPFLQQYASSSQICADTMKQVSFYQTSVFSISKDLFLASSRHIKYGQMSYKETPDYIRYIAEERNQDTGTLDFTEWFLYRPSVEKTAPTIGVLSILPDGVILPECKNFWFEDKHLYVENPWNLNGIFEYYFFANQKEEHTNKITKLEAGVIYCESQT